MSAASVEQAQRRPSLQHRGGDLPELIEGKGPVIFAPIFKRPPAEAPEGFGQTRPDIVAVSVHPSSVPVVNIDGSERRGWSKWPCLSGPRREDPRWREALVGGMCAPNDDTKANTSSRALANALVQKKTKLYRSPSKGSTE